MTRHYWAAIAVVDAVVALAAASPTILPSGDVPSEHFQTATSRGDCVLTGRIVDADAMPVDRVTVRLAGSDGPGARIAVSDSAGLFTFSGLAAGSFTLSAVKAGYLTSFFGSSRPGRGPAIPFALAADHPTNVSMTLVRAAIISGTITGEFGQPMPQVQVQVRPASGRSVADTAIATSDNRGGYRVFGIAPGDYVVAAIPPGFSSAEATLVTDDEVKWALQQLSGGQGAPAVRSPLSPPFSPILAYTTVFFPGTTAVDGAAKISLIAGEERDVTFSLHFITTATISGTVVTSYGTPSSATLYLLSKGSDVPWATDATADGALKQPVSVSDDGRFAIRGVPPGANTLIARWDPDVAARVSGPTSASRWGELDVQIEGRDISDLVVPLQPGAKLTGTVRFESKAGTKPPESASVRVGLSPVRTAPLGLTGDLLAPIGQAGTFAFLSLMPGSYVVKVVPASIPSSGAQWTLKSVVADGHDVTDGYLAVRHGDAPHQIIVTLTDVRTELYGTLLDGANRPTSAFSVVVFTASPDFWTRGSRRIQATQPANDGRFQIVGLPAGSYYLVAVADLDSDALGDPGFLEQLRQSALMLILSDGESRSLDLRIRGR